MSGEKIKICHIIASLEQGGVENHTLELAKHYDKEKFDVFLVFFVRRDGPIEMLVKKAGIRYYKVDRGGKKIGLVELFKILRIFIKERPSIIRTHLLGADVWGRIMALKYKWFFGWGKSVKIIITIHDVSPDMNGFTKFVYRFLGVFTSYHTAISNRVKQYMREDLRISGDIYVVNNSVDIEKFSGRVRRDIVPYRLISVGRLTKQKGHKYLLETVNLLRKKYPEIKLTIVGEGELREELEAMVSNLGIQDHVKFYGITNEVPRLLLEHDIFVLPSLWEGFGNVLVEASASGLPIVASNVDGIPEVVQDGKNGILVDSKNPDALAEAITRLIEDQELYQRFSSASIENAKRFDVKKIAKQFEELYIKSKLQS